MVHVLAWLAQASNTSSLLFRAVTQLRVRKCYPRSGLAIQLILNCSAEGRCGDHHLSEDLRRKSQYLSRGGCRWTGPAVVHAWWCAALADRILRAEAVAAQPLRGKTWELRSPTGGRNFLGKSMEIANQVGVATECIYKFSLNFGSFSRQFVRRSTPPVRAAIETSRFFPDVCW